MRSAVLQTVIRPGDDRTTGTIADNRSRPLETNSRTDRDAVCCPLDVAGRINALGIDVSLIAASSIGPRHDGAARSVGGDDVFELIIGGRTDRGTIWNPGSARGPRWYQSQQACDEYNPVCATHVGTSVV
jgi:hypothetical protein